jgi:hypothetical protein
MIKCAPKGNERPRRDWPRAAHGILLVGIACFLLLNSTGRLPWSFWLDAIALWPLLVVSMGANIAFEKSRVPWLVLLGPLAILGGLTWLATGARPGLPSGPWEPQTASRPAGVESLELKTSLVGARLRVVGADVPSDRIVDGRLFRRNEHASLEVSADGPVARVEIKTGSRRGRFFFLPRPREHWDLKVPRELPLRVHLQGVGIGAQLDLTRQLVQGARAEGVFIGLEVLLPAPAQDTQLRMNGVFNSLDLTVPPGTPVRVHGARAPFNLVARGLAGEPGRPGYDVHVDGIFSAVAVQADPGISPSLPPRVSARRRTRPGRWGRADPR